MRVRSPITSGTLIVLGLLAAALGIGLAGGMLARQWRAELPPHDAGAGQAVTGSNQAPGAPPPPLIDLNLSDAGLPTAEPAALALGSAVYARHCASCHGARGEGEPDWQVERADGTLPAPPHDASGHTWHHADAELIRIIRDGGTVYMPNSRMPAFGETLSPAEIQAVLDYIKASFWGPRERVYQADVSRQWEAARGALPAVATVTPPDEPADG